MRELPTRGTSDPPPQASRAPERMAVLTLARESIRPNLLRSPKLRRDCVLFLSLFPSYTVFILANVNQDLNVASYSSLCVISHRVAVSTMWLSPSQMPERATEEERTPS